VSHRALIHWMDVLERLYHVFRVRPHGGPRGRSLTKMPKAYWSLVPDRAARFENLVMSHPLKRCLFGIPSISIRTAPLSMALRRGSLYCGPPLAWK
jgi:hypothetical protein